MEIPKQSLDPEASLGYQVRRCHRIFDRLLNIHLASHDLGSGFWYYLRILWQQDGLTQRDLSDATNVAENSTAVTLTAMTKRGLIERVRDAVDRRKMRVYLASGVGALEEQLMPLAIRINQAAMAGIDPAEVEICLSVLKRVTENLERERFLIQGVDVVKRPAEK